MNPAEVFARHVLSLGWDDLPEAAQAAARRFYRDTLGVGIAGSKAAYADKVLAIARGWGTAQAVPAATVWNGPRLPAAAAAYVNGFQIHGQEYDCVHERAVVHPFAVIGAALTAEAEARGASGADLLAAIVGAVDVAAGIGVAVTSPIRFFRPANAGLIGAAFGISRLRGFDVDTTLDAAGYALAQAAGTMQAHVEGTPALPVQIAAGARAAILAADLAGAGLPGPHDMLEGPYGYFPLFEERWNLAPVLDSLGTVFRITELSHKPWPTGRAAQGGIAMALQLRGDGLEADEIEQVTLTAPPLVARLVGRRAGPDMGVAHARLCFAYTGAVALRRGAVRLDDFTAQALRDPATLALAGRIAVESDGSQDPAAFTPQTLTVRLKSGAVKRARTEALYGSPANPMSEADARAKLEHCLDFAGAEGGADALTRAVDELDRQPDIRTLTGLLGADA